MRDEDEGRVERLAVDEVHAYRLYACTSWLCDLAAPSDLH